MHIQISKWVRISAGSLSKFGLRLCASSAVAGILYASAHTGYDDATVMREAEKPVAVAGAQVPDMGLANDAAVLAGPTSPATPAQAAPMPTPAPRVRTAAKRAVPTQATSSQVVRTRKGDSQRIKSAGVERFDACTLDCETRDPLIVGYRNALPPAPPSRPMVEQTAANYADAVMRGGQDFFGRAGEASSAALNTGRQALVGVVGAIW